MEALAFTAVAIVLYLAADALLDRVEHLMGRRLRFRSLVFFAILGGMAVIVFAVLERTSPGL